MGEALNVVHWARGIVGLLMADVRQGQVRQQAAKSLKSLSNEICTNLMCYHLTGFMKSSSFRDKEVAYVSAHKASPMKVMKASSLGSASPEQFMQYKRRGPPDTVAP